MSHDTPVRWGILATGKIAHTFARDLHRTPGAELVAVGSRRLGSAEAFAAEHGGRPHGSYEELVADPDVDVVYIATPHAFHLDNARLAFEAGKHVLCEKPLTLSSAEAEEMVALARRHDRFLMEAMWTACHPTIAALRRRLAAGEFGTPRHFHAELGFVVTGDAGDRMFDPALGASALLDMGVYPLTVAHLLFGEAEATSALADTRSAPGGTYDTDVAIVARYPRGVLATLTASITSWSSRAAQIATDTGRIDLDDFHHPSRAVFTPKPAIADWTADEAPVEPVEIEPDGPLIGAGYGNEIAEVGRCLREGLRESPLVPHAQTLALLRQMDDVRRQVGVQFS
ncbi:Gfo/Idh/MocA family oxidoreductase [Nocardioides sp. CER19]|uniref:Gfo/Idh/MocA family protein n=1 Tax=Nocardioides sp. CER19 TaxID=3038538 RepID=UPI00244C5530|nr:Gfo/Idh/MocA family oxidoreductase [Nocardioides sp. CER19]MDH2413427.1 Gfo/Idh/MocA family oxidoreductase [Nocardioides sp. CER19]